MTGVSLKYYKYGLLDESVTLDYDIVYSPARLTVAPRNMGFKADRYTRPDDPTYNVDLLQDAMDEISETGGGRLFARGTNITNAALTMKSNVNIWGDGWTTCFAGSSSSGTFSIFDYDHDNASASNFIENFELAYCKIDGANVNPPAYSTSLKGVFVKFMKKSRFHNLYVVDTGASALGIDFLVDCFVTNNLIENAGRLVTNPATHEGGSGIGIGVGGYSNEPLVISNNVVRDCGKYGIFFEAQNSGTNSNYMFCNNNISYGNLYGLGNRGVSNVDFMNNIVFSSGSHGFMNDDSPFSSYVSNNLRVMNNKFINNAGYGIRFSGTHQNSTIEGNEVRGNTQGAMNIDGGSATVLRNNPGFNPVSVGTVAIGASPGTYTATTTPETLYIKGGTVSSITKGGVELFTATDKTLVLEPNQTAVITYSDAPTLIRERR